VGEGLWIVPIWSQAPDPSATNIRLEPGLAFGTGDHPTTRLCLCWLRGLQRGGRLAGAAVMDYGAGSGVLAVAALLMGADRAVRHGMAALLMGAALRWAAGALASRAGMCCWLYALQPLLKSGPSILNCCCLPCACFPAGLQVGTDIEPLAVKATRANAELNSVAQRLTAYQCAADLGLQEPLAAAGVPPEQRLFEVTVANILQVGGGLGCAMHAALCCAVVCCAALCRAALWCAVQFRALRCGVP
jgi:hypothetical protein